MRRPGRMWRPGRTRQPSAGLLSHVCEEESRASRQLVRAKGHVCMMARVRKVFKREVRKTLGKLRPVVDILVPNL